MFRCTIHRLMLTIPVPVGISIVVFLIMAIIPGDPATAILGAFATPENAIKLRAEMGLDRPLIEQYFTWAGNLLSGDFGPSYALNRPVLDELLERMGPTLLLAGSARCVCVVLGLISGLLAPVKQYTWVDQGLTLFTLVEISAPSFWLGLMAVSLFTVQLGWLSASKMYTSYGDESRGDLLVQLLMPAVTLGLVASSVIARLTRTSMLEQLRQDYVRTARAKGERETAVVIKHAFQNALVDLIPILGLQARLVLGGASLHRKEF